MEDHWEIGVVTAFRDVQWMLKKKDKFFPGINLGLSGNAEGAAGDTLADLGGRYYIFEFKSDQSKCRDEWDGKGWAKGAHLSLMSLCRSIEDSPGNHDFMTLLKYSLRCHHFLYWGQPSRSSHGILDHLYFEPYLLYSLYESVGDEAAATTDGVVRPSGLFKKDLFKEYCCEVKEGSGRLAKCPLTLSDLVANKAELVRVNEKGERYSLPFGLKIQDFQKYLDFICGRGSGNDTEDLKVLICSDQGFFRVVRKASQLAQILKEISGGDFSPTPGRLAKSRSYWKR